MFLVERDLGGDATKVAGDGRRQYPVECRDCLQLGHDQDRASFVFGFGPPDVSLLWFHHGSSAIICTVAPSAHAKSSLVWG